MDFLFDIGNVLIEVDFGPSLKSLIPDECKNKDLIVDQLLEKKDELESGQISNEEFTRWALAKLQSPASHDDFQLAWNHIFTPISKMWNVVESLHADGHRLILFSNTNGLHKEFFEGEYAIFKFFHGAVYSHEIGCMKPHQPFYTHAIDHFQLTPEHTIYIDDLPENIATGNQLGFRSYQYNYNDHDSFASWLKQQLS